MQVTEGDDSAVRSGNNERRGPLMLSTAPPKPSDIDDRFGRFDVKDMILGDETRSLVSDSWSTDVLGSDSELVNETMDRDRQSERSLSIRLLYFILHCTIIYSKIMYCFNNHMNYIFKSDISYFCFLFIYTILATKLQ